MVRWRLVLPVLVALALPALPAAAAKPFRADRFDVRLALSTDGSLVVTEHAVFVFGPDPFTTVFRELPTRRTDGITVVSASMDGIPLDRGKSQGQVEVRRTDNGRRRVTWRFAPTANSTHTFELTYRVLGVVVPAGDEDAFAWHLLPASHEYPIACSRVQVVPPAGFSGPYSVTVDPPATRNEREATGASTFERCGIDRNETWVATIRFPLHALAQGPPAWQETAARARRWGPAFATAGGLILVSGLMLLFFYWNNHRATLASDDRTGREPAPRGDLPVALAGVLTRSAALPTWGNLVAALLDLARRGFIRIDEADKRWGQRQFSVIKVGEPRDLPSHERVVMDMLFVTGKGPRGSVKLSDLKTAAPKAWKLFRRAVREDLRQRGLISSERERSSAVLQRIGLAVVVVAIAGLAVAASFVARFQGWPLAVPVSLLVVGVVTFGVAASLSPLSDEGLRQAVHWKAFSRSLADAGRARGRAADPARFEAYLTYAVTFGVALAWAKALQKGGAGAMPGWLGHLGHEGEGGMAGLVAVLSAAHGAGGQVHGHAAGAAAAGAAGGGASGAH